MKNYKIISMYLISIFFIIQCTGTVAAGSNSPIFKGILAQADPNPGYGAESYQGTDPIGGGLGYGEIFSQEDADYVVNDLTALITVLSNAQPNEIIFVASDINMNGCESITIPEGVTLAGNRGAGVKGRSKGAIIYDDNRGDWDPIIFAEANVRITGLCIRGPFSDVNEDEEYPNCWALGIYSNKPNLEIDNCEIYNWPYSGIILCEEQENVDNFYAGAINAYIHHNTIHHCQILGLGYGISLGLFQYDVSKPRYMGAVSALIEANEFYKCRHVIASIGNIGKRYEACYNIISEVGESLYSHMMDVHGGYDRINYGDQTYIANNWVSIHHNTFMPTGQSEDKYAIAIRGIPIEGGLIYHNWFWNSDPNMGIWQCHCFGEPGNLYVWENRYGTDEPPNISNYYQYFDDW